MCSGETSTGFISDRHDLGSFQILFAIGQLSADVLDDRRIRCTTQTTIRCRRNEEMLLSAFDFLRVQIVVES